MRIREAKPSDAPAIARVHVDTWRTTYAGLIPEEVLSNLSYERREQFWKEAISGGGGRDFIYVIEDDAGGVAGFASGGPVREGRLGYEGEIYAIYLLAEHQGKGWGKQLFLKAVQRLLEEGINSTMLWVLANNPSRGFYAALGGKPVGEQEIEIGGQMLTEVAYGWNRLEKVLG